MVLHKVAREGLTENVTFESKLERGKRASFANMWGRSNGRAQILR